MRAAATLAAALALALLGGCQTGKIERLNREIAETGERLVAVERQINAGTADIASESEGIRAQVRYRPLVAWAQAFSAAPPARRTIRFQQTDFKGNIKSQSRRCSRRNVRPGYWVRFANDRATSASLYVASLAVRPEPDGLLFEVPLEIKGRAQFAGNVHSACFGWSAGTNVGIGLGAKPDTAFRLRFGQIAHDRLSYDLSLARPNRIDVKVSVGLNRFGDIDFTIPFRTMVQELAGGEVGLLYRRDGSIALPDGRRIGYHVETVHPAIRSDSEGVTVSSDFDIRIDQPPPS
jgi:hypothetical protein